jgi:hypothetical protein
MKKPEGDIGAQHNYGAMCDLENLHYTEYEGQAHGCEPVERPYIDSVDEHLQVNLKHFLLPAFLGYS